MPGTTIRFRRNTSVDWISLNPVLSAGEPGDEIDTGRYKMGDGHSRWTELDYFIPRVEILAAIQEAVANSNPGSPAGQQSLTAHINSETPHPVYDDGPSLLLLYENAKV